MVKHSGSSSLANFSCTIRCYEYSPRSNRIPRTRPPLPPLTVRRAPSLTSSLHCLSCPALANTMLLPTLRLYLFITWLEPTQVMSSRSVCLSAPSSLHLSFIMPSMLTCAIPMSEVTHLRLDNAALCGRSTRSFHAFFNEPSVHHLLLKSKYLICIMKPP